MRRVISRFGKKSIYGTGLLSGWHGRRNRGRLTVVMFHRVIPREHPAWSYSEPSWLVSDSIFRECLHFFARHYNVVGLEALLDICCGRKQAPERPLLITFDDGWFDTLEYAAPLLQQYGMPAVLFVVVDGIGRHELWHEALIRTWRQKQLRGERAGRLWRAAGGDDAPEPPSWEDFHAIWPLIARLSLLTPSRRDELIGEIVNASGVPAKPEMLSYAQLRLLRAAGISIASHGLTHTPIPYAADPVHELSGSRAALAGLLGDASHAGLEAFSFPRGIYDNRAIGMAAKAGYQLLFTSDEHLNLIPNPTVSPLVLGRINVPSPVISDDSGRFNPEALAWWLFPRQPHLSGRT